jgi:alpha 1,3-glucosidase
MIDAVAKRKRKMVTIVDPHIKRESGYFVHDEAQQKDYYIKNKDRNTYEGHCWPGSVSYLDFLNPTVRKFWAGKFAYDQYKGSTGDLFTWNDMNEPSVFNGPETTMQKDCIHHDGQDEYEHRDVHNLYGMLQQMATSVGQVDRTGGKHRPFVLSRAFFAGSQNYGAIWTGDNKADWGHLAASTPMLLSQGVAGLPFSGADVGGFFGNPDSELLVRWYQAGAWQPFFRGHAHIETKRREPWLFGEENTKMIQAALRLRYQHLPLWYTLFHQAAIDNTPMMQPLWFQWPEQQELFAVDDQFMVGDAIMVKPVVSAGTTSVNVQLPGPDPWYDGHTHMLLAPGVHDVPASLAVIPFFHRGGSIVPRRDRPRRNSALMLKDPFTLVVALNSQQEAKGQIYLDDGHSFDWKTGAFIWRDFSFANSELKATAHSTDELAGTFTIDCVVERLIVLGLAPGELKKVVALVPGKDPVDLEWSQQPGSSKVVVRKPEVPISSDWSISFER